MQLCSFLYGCIVFVHVRLTSFCRKEGIAIWGGDTANTARMYCKAAIIRGFWIRPHPTTFNQSNRGANQKTTATPYFTILAS